MFPLGLLSKFELLDLYGVDLPTLVETLPQVRYGKGPVLKIDQNL